MKKRIFSLFTMLFCCILVFTAISPVYAVDSETIISSKRTDLDDGNYIIEEVAEIVTPTQSRATSSKSGSKTATYYNSSNEAIFAVKVTGTFTYDGTTAKATSSTGTVYIYDSSATYVSKSTNYSSNFATVTGKVKYNNVTLSKTVTLYCSATGVLS